MEEHIVKNEHVVIRSKNCFIKITINKPISEKVEVFCSPTGEPRKDVRIFKYKNNKTVKVKRDFRRENVHYFAIGGLMGEWLRSGYTKQSCINYAKATLKMDDATIKEVFPGLFSEFSQLS